MASKKERYMSRLTQEDIETLRRIDTPTICNLIETIAPGRRGHGFTFQHLHCAFPTMGPIVGYARTATMRARVPGGRSLDESVSFREKYLDYVGRGSEPKISIVQDLDEHPGYGALWGEVFACVHKALGVSGVVTNGSVRDVDMIPGDFQLLSGLVAPSRAYVHLSDFACEVNVHGMTVNDDDLIHADKHGAVVIPHEAVGEIPRALDLINRKEKVIIDAARAQNCTVETLKAAFRASAKITS
jgi:regulator of RNase E activity RraA